jgi:uncharacterized protein
MNKNLIIYLHGFRSSAESSKFNILKNMFPQEKVIALDYSPHIPNLAAEQISKVITDHYHEYDILVIGTSLGGFWARWAANRFWEKSILINPSLHPDKTLSVGIFSHYQDPNKKIEVTQQNLTSFLDYKVDPVSETHAVVLLAMDDEVIDANATKEELKDVHSVICFNRGGHRFNQFESMEYIISGILNSIVSSGLTNE